MPAGETARALAGGGAATRGPTIAGSGTDVPAPFDHLPGAQRTESSHSITLGVITSDCTRLAPHRGPSVTRDNPKGGQRIDRRAGYARAMSLSANKGLVISDAAFPAASSLRPSDGRIGRAPSRVAPRKALQQHSHLRVHVGAGSSWSAGLQRAVPKRRCEVELDAAFVSLCCASVRGGLSR